MNNSMYIFQHQGQTDAQSYTNHKTWSKFRQTMYWSGKYVKQKVNQGTSKSFLETMKNRDGVAVFENVKGSEKHRQQSIMINGRCIIVWKQGFCYLTAPLPYILKIPKQQHVKDKISTSNQQNEMLPLLYSEFTYITLLLW